ncbi:16S rRNA pseudouridine(516) synthase RsuA [Aidingimonas halophila]|uniref:Pseudouridine synthase n=1 Tax=Aidingimonas halophila TaxID=574349 RepID=A0A1H3BEG8_9GAMM|nr:16S rRNA pseudouridine(516) synthase RsuA [Aidingimonas halophila]GHC26381.1 pseudouridine synthase [Aidingimonas halophila]SDX40296.1 ribosomal small subunit pseudouridine synthase A [Aidingimonas halophila]
MRLDKYLCDTASLTRNLAKRAIRREEVRVDGHVTRDAAMQVTEENDVEWLGQRLVLSGPRYLMMNKPSGIECTSHSSHYQTVFELIDLPNVQRLHSAGRLDVDTTGLVFLTDDGQWSHRVTSPRHACKKVYLATLADPLEGEVAEKVKKAFAEGVQLKGENRVTRPASLELLSPVDARITIQEGKYHQVRRMFAAFGNHVEALHRESVGPVSLDPDLAPGESRMLRQAEILSF